jgi:hypothetical protein
MNTELPKFLIEMSEQMNNEDNRCTADPVWQVRCKRTRVTSSDFSDIFEIVDRENEHQLVATNKENDDVNEQIVDYLQCDVEDLPVALESWVDNDSNDEALSGEDKVAYFLENFDCSYDDIEGFEVLWVEEYEDIVQGAFLTEQDANWFINRKQHDYPKLYTYVASMYFCPQMKELRAWIKSITKDTNK